MEKIFKSKVFLVITPIINFLLFLVAGVLLSYVPYTSGTTSGASYIWGKTSTVYIFSIKNAIGIWLIGIAVSIFVLLVCVLIRKISLKTVDNK